MSSAIKFEDALERLEEIVKELETGDIELEKALELFEEGTRLARICAKKLTQAERKVEVLKKGKNSEETLELFEGLNDSNL